MLLYLSSTYNILIYTAWIYPVTWWSNPASKYITVDCLKHCLANRKGSPLLGLCWTNVADCVFSYRVWCDPVWSGHFCFLWHWYIDNNLQPNHVHIMVYLPRKQNTQCSYNVGPPRSTVYRRWYNIMPALEKRFVFIDGWGRDEP